MLPSECFNMSEICEYHRRVGGFELLPGGCVTKDDLRAHPVGTDLEGLEVAVPPKVIGAEACATGRLAWSDPPPW